MRLESLLSLSSGCSSHTGTCEVETGKGREEGRRGGGKKGGGGGAQGGGEKNMETIYWCVQKRGSMYMHRCLSILIMHMVLEEEEVYYTHIQYMYYFLSVKFR